jgi:DNA-binding transcriptional regulator YbjK
MRATGARAVASRQVRDTIVAATVRVVAREGVAAVTHRRVAAEAGVSLSSTTWHFATKADILRAALDWTVANEVTAIAARVGPLLDAGRFDPGAWAEALGDWLVDQVTEERESAIALYRLQIELLGAPGTPAVHVAWGERLRALGDEVLADSETAAVDMRLVIAALDGLRLGTLMAEADPEALRPAVRRQLQALFG